MGALAYDTECEFVAIEKRDGCGRLKKHESESNDESFGSTVPPTTEHYGKPVSQVNNILSANDRDAHQMSFRLFAIGRGAGQAHARLGKEAGFSTVRCLISCDLPFSYMHTLSC